MLPQCQSITAEHNAALRAIEALRAPAERLCFDPWARFFVPPRLAAAVASIHRGRQLIERWETVVPGVCGAILARTAFIDACLNRALGRGIEQLVILGAGFDTRALRFAPFAAGVRVFELDHPATQAVKIARLSRVCRPLPDHIHFIPIRFETEDAGAKLLAQGYDPKRRTFFIWEGVTYYLGAAAVDALFGFIANHGPAGSRLVFDYLDPAVIEGTCARPEAAGLRLSLARFGEALRFGIRPASLGDFLQQRRFTLVAQMRSDRYSPRRGCSPLFFFVQAKITGTPRRV